MTAPRVRPWGLKELRRITIKAQAAGFLVKDSNGGGWPCLAKLCGFTLNRKQEDCRRYLRGFFYPGLNGTPLGLCPTAEPITTSRTFLVGGKPPSKPKPAVKSTPKLGKSSPVVYLPTSSRTQSAPPNIRFAGDVNHPDFLTSYAWRQVRMVALKKYGATCQCCGASPSNGAVMNVDHIKPRRLFPHLALDADNLQVLCGDCNHGKGNWDQTDWRPKEPTEPDIFAAEFDAQMQHIRSIAHAV